MSHKSYCRHLDTEDKAIDLCRSKNKSSQKRYSYEMYAIIDGPVDQYSVADIETAIDTGMDYRIPT